MKNGDDINGFLLDNTNILFFNIFIKNNKLYLIRPCYKDNIDKSSIRISYNSINLINLHEIKSINDGPIIILIYDFNFNSEDIYKIEVIFDDKIKSKVLTKTFMLKNKKTYKNKNLALTTLFKSDYKLMNIFYDYYKKQGVEHFYMYYNGKISNEIKKYYDKEDITLVEWNYVYNNNKSVIRRHHAQPGQMHDALYRFGKDEYEYMIFCDLDEYLYINDKKIIDLLEDRSVDSYGFRNVWANSKDNKVPEEFPDEFYITDEIPPHYTFRSKAIHKTDTMNNLNIHSGVKFKSHNINIKSNNIMFHFHSWGGLNCSRYKTVNLINLNNFKYTLKACVCPQCHAAKT